MSAPAIHQLVAGFRQGDAISNEARAIRKVFRGWGAVSEIVCEGQRAAPQVRSEIRTPEEILPAIRPGDVALDEIHPALPHTGSGGENGMALTAR